MMGRDFQAMGTEDGVKMRYGDGGNYPYMGPIRVRFIDKNTIAVIDANKVVSLQNLGGKCMLRGAPIEQKPPPKDDDDDSDDGYGAKEVDKTHYIDLNPSDLVAFPGTSNLAVTDEKLHKFLHINKRTWEVENEYGKEGQKAGEFKGISGVDCFKLGTDVLFCISEAQQHRIQVLSETGEPLAAFGGGNEGGFLQSGHGDDSFFFPLGISAFLEPNKRNPGSLGDTHYPRWYLGEASIDEIEAKLADEYIAGHFFVGRRPGFPHIFDLVYVTSKRRHIRTTIERSHDGTYLRRDVDQDGGQTFPSILRIIQRSPWLVKEKDKRPSALIAVADSENSRVQVLRYYWTTNDLTAPQFQKLFTLGGLRGAFYPLRRPTCVAYSPSGELGVCDSDSKCVLVFSQVMSVIRKISLAFTPSYSVRLQMETNKSLVTANKTPVSLSFSSDGKIAVGYKSGGIMLHNAYKAFALGNLEQLMQVDFERVMSFLTYKDAVCLRDTCWFLHNYTRRKRANWDLYPMRSNQYHRVVWGFLKWSTMARGGKKLLGPFFDEHGKPICIGYQEGICNHQKSCPNSHATAALDSAFVEESGACLDRKNLNIVLVSIFGPHFYWKYELYIGELMIAYGKTTVLEHRGDPMSRRNEVVRDVRYDDSQTIGLKGYLEVMNYCEEVYQGQKEMHEHTLFTRKGKDRYRPKAEYDPDNHPVAWVDALAQYNSRGIDVPFKVDRFKKYRVVPGYEDAKRKALSPKAEHLSVHRTETEKAVGLINSLFKTLDFKEENQESSPPSGAGRGRGRRK